MDSMAKKLIIETLFSIFSKFYQILFHKYFKVENGDIKRLKIQIVIDQIIKFTLNNKFPFFPSESVKFLTVFFYNSVF